MFGLDLVTIIAGLPGLIIAMVVHEYAHARTAVYMGDYTPRLMGRLTLNPLAHIDIIGFLMLLIARFGWAKPVIINPKNFKNWRQGELLVSLAGPMANLITAFLALCFLGFYAKLEFPITYGLRLVFYLIVIYNINFAIFNMIPIPPLDGSKVLIALLPEHLAYKLASLEKYSMLIMIIFLTTPILEYIFIPAQKFIFMLFNTILNIIF